MNQIHPKIITYIVKIGFEKLTNIYPKPIKIFSTNSFSNLYEVIYDIDNDEYREEIYYYCPTSKTFYIYNKNCWKDVYLLYCNNREIKKLLINIEPIIKDLFF